MANHEAFITVKIDDELRQHLDAIAKKLDSMQAPQSESITATVGAVGALLATSQRRFSRRRLLGLFARSK